MNFHNVKMEFVFPLFAGVLGSLILCMSPAVSSANVLVYGQPENIATADFTEETEPEEYDCLFTAPVKKTPDPILERYSDPEYREWVIDYFTELCSSREIADTILAYSEHFGVPPALAFALSWEESRFNPRAVNLKNLNESIDRGLFQLNDRSFPHLEIGTFFNINDNTRYGIGHLRHCLDTTGFEIAALAMYNAGEGRIKNIGTPKVTLDYLNRILENRIKIEDHFSDSFLRKDEVILVEEDEIQEQPPAKVRNYLGRTFIAASPLWPSL
ncbi:MAG: lytic transglycosylase domain-containing protein [Treponema sp.]|nr:lytic transglycosylase domain-containing protein [Treponema sp.]